MEECFKHTDLEWRLGQIPDSAGCRGVFFNMLNDRAVQFGETTNRAYRDFFTTTKFSAFRLYPVKDFLTRLVKLSEIQFGASHIYPGIFTIQSSAWPSWRRTLMGRVSFSVLGNDFGAILKLIGVQFNNVLNFGQFEAEKIGPNRFKTTFRNQYVYIEHAMAGALSGVAEACGVRAELDVRLDDPFNGTIEMSVLPPTR